jgi:dTDP-4-amino-4,6-dideoxygalactose transaminase
VITATAPGPLAAGGPAEAQTSDEVVPFLDLTASHAELEKELIDSFREIVRSARFIGGPNVEAFEKEFAAHCGTRYCIGVSSGTDALRFALLASDIGPGDAVVTVAHTFLATVEAISQAGAETEFVDIQSRTYTMDPDALDQYLSACERDPASGRPIGRRSGKPIKALLPVHLYGQVADMDAIVVIGERYGLAVIEDACQAHGAEYLSGRARNHIERRRTGGLGKAAAFSFYPGKNLGACGEAGAVTTNDDDVARRVRMLRDHGQSQKYYHEIQGYNGRLDALQAAVLRIKLRRLDKWNAERREAARRYGELFRQAGLAAITPFEPSWSRSVYHLYVIRSKMRDALARYLKQRGIDTGLHYPVPAHLQRCCGPWRYGRGSLPATEQAAAEVLSLPMFPTLTPAQQARVVDEVHTFMTRGPLAAA